MLPKLIVVGTIVFTLALAIFLIPKHKTSTNNTGPIVFLGNSLTAGQGAREGEDFPSLIGKSLDVAIVNAGVSGNTTAEALTRLDRDVIAYNPSVVVVELGANDLFSRTDSKVTKRNFELILSKIKPTEAKIVILGVKIFLFNQKYETDLQDLSKKYNATLVPDILEGIITDDSLKFDDIHPNAKGYQKIADRLTPIIASLINK